MTATIFLPNGIVPAEVGRLAGVDTSSPDWAVFRDGWLTIWAVDQDAAIAALAAYDPANIPPDPAAAIAAGLELVWTGAADLSGTYAIDAEAQRKISGIAAGIGARNRLPGGLATFDYTDGFGTHTFTAAQFLDLASAVEDHLYALSRGTPPTQPVTIP